MNRVTIVTRLRFAAAIAPAILLIAAPILALVFYGFGEMPSALYQNEYSALRAANGMQIAIYRMDWGRAQPDGAEIVLDQQRRFATWVGTAQSHIATRQQAELLDRITNHAKPLFDQMRQAGPGDGSFEPRLRDLQGMVADLINADDEVLTSVSAIAMSRARTMIALALVAGVAIPWVCFAWLAALTSRLHRRLREMRHRVESLGERAGAPPPEDLRALDSALAELGFPKPNPMLAE
jgi:hypothetical protein